MPQQGRLRIATELGVLEVEPQEIAVIPRGMRFRVELPDGAARGYVCENFGAPLRLPDLGPIGCERPRQPARLPDAGRGVRGRRRRVRAGREVPGPPVARATSTIRRSTWSRWHGNYAPYKYDLRRFNTIGSVSFDHPDPSIFTVLHLAVSDTPGTANIDFVIFPPRWLVAQDTFRPPWFHRNVTSEFMGLIARRLRRQGRGLRARRRIAAQLHERPRPGRGDVREGQQRRPVEAAT